MPRSVRAFDGKNEVVGAAVRNLDAQGPLESILTCPACAHAQVERMPVDACQYFYECTRCGTLLKPKPGDCCVFCSYGTVKCPPKQAGSVECRCGP